MPWSANRISTNPGSGYALARRRPRVHTGRPRRYSVFRRSPARIVERRRPWRAMGRGLVRDPGTPGPRVGGHHRDLHALEAARQHQAIRTLEEGNALVITS